MDADLNCCAITVAMLCNSACSTGSVLASSHSIYILSAPLTIDLSRVELTEVKESHPASFALVRSQVEAGRSWLV